PKGLQNFTKKEKFYQEFIYEICENTTMEQCQELTHKIAELTGFTPLLVVIHRDEVCENAKGEKLTHYHAHAVFFTLDYNGLQLAR
ncbi:mobilization protein, partial [Campylobacter coli]